MRLCPRPSPNPLIQPLKSFYIVFEELEKSKKIVDLVTYNYVYKNILNKYSYPMSSINKELLDDNDLKNSLFDQTKAESETEEKIIREKVKTYNSNLDVLYVPNIFLEMAFTFAYFTDYDKDKNLFDIPDNVKNLKNAFLNGQNVADYSENLGSNLFCKFKEMKDEIEKICGPITKTNFYLEISFLDDLNTEKIIENIDGFNNHSFIVYSNYYVNNLIIQILNSNKDKELKEIFSFLIESFKNVIKENVLTSVKDFYYYLLAGYSIEKNNIFNMQSNIFGFDRSPRTRLKDFVPDMKDFIFGVETGSFYLSMFNLINYKSMFNFVTEVYGIKEYNKSKEMIEVLFPENKDEINIDYVKSKFFEYQTKIFNKIFDTEIENHSKSNDFYLYRYSNVFENDEGKLDTNFREKFFLDETGQFRSISFANNLFGGMIGDPKASTLYFFLGSGLTEKAHILYSLPVKKTLIWDKDNIFYISPFSTILSFFSAGEWFHTRTKIANSGLPTVDFIKSYQIVIRGLYNFILVESKDLDEFFKDFEPYKEYNDKKDAPDEINDKMAEILINFTKKSITLNPDRLKEKSNILFGDFSFQDQDKKFNEGLLNKKAILYKNF
ncbi:hypothetical protein L6269_02400 [Candidatus Dependentiae bacterium]|nr:hypothetical protein [Candidatus Dependentiae bacterium]